NGARLALTSLRAKRATAVRELEAVLGRQLRERGTPDHARTQIISRLALRHDDLTSHDPVLALVRRSMRLVERLDLRVRDGHVADQRLLPRAEPQLVPQVVTERLVGEPRRVDDLNVRAIV